MPGLFIIGVTAWSALWHYRHTTIFAVAWMCYAPVMVEGTRLGDMMEKVWQGNSRFLTLIFLILGVSGIFYATQKHFWQLRIPAAASEEKREGVPVYPVGVVNYLKEQGFSGNAMVPYDAGAYVSWNLYPEVKVSMDSRFHMAYPAALVAENVKFYGAQKGWRPILLKYKTDAVLVPRWSKLEKAMAKSVADPQDPIAARWKRVYVDDGYSLYERADLAGDTRLTDDRGKPLRGHFP